MALDIKEIYLKMQMKRYEYLCLRLSTIPNDVIEEYKFHEKATHNSYVYVEVCKGMYGLPQEGIITQELLGYSQRKITPGFWTHKCHLMTFSLVVDDFSIRYVEKEHANHLIAVLEEDYNLDKD